MQSDALGRLSGVCEVSSSTLLGSGGTPIGCGLDIAATGFLTSYGYDLLNNLTTITQGSLINRSFSYDSLSRLTSESHPEWGSGSQSTYTYNSDSLLISRTRPAPNQTNIAVTVTTNYGYDALHRLVTRTYSGDPSGTPSAGFNYDEGTAWSQTLLNTIGRLSSESSGSTGQIFGYDPMGRVTINWQCTPRVCGTTAYLLGYTYDLAGDLATQSNGVGVTFTYGYNAAPRLTSMTSSLVDSQHPATLLNNMHYGPFGLISDTLGNGLNETIGYSSRGLLNFYSSTPYTFSLTGLAGDGTITAGNDSVNGNWTYTYDQFNRLASSSKSTAPVQGFSYAYDRYGNRWQQNVTAGTGPAPQYLLDNTTNRINGSGITYDALGNVLTDGLGNSYTYDAENRLTKVNNGTTATYTYDAEGRRIKNASTEFLYDLSGRAVTLLDATTGGWNYGEIYAGTRHLGTYSGSTTNFLHSDWLGSKRVMTGLTGAVTQTCTGLPFGDGINCTGTNWNFNLFTDDAHDFETNLEHTWFRQLSTTQGRWMGADPYRGSIDLTNPQSMNRYSYVINNPMNMVDPLGLHLFLVTSSSLCTFTLDGGKVTDVNCSLVSQTVTDLQPGSDGAGGTNAPDKNGCLPPGVSGPPTPECLAHTPPSINCATSPPPAPPAPGTASVDANVQFLTSLYQQSISGPPDGSPGPAVVFTTWLSNVVPGGGWDYRGHYGNQYAAFGNFNYGATCNAIGLSLEGCQRGAGLAAYGTSALNVLAGNSSTAGPGNPLGSPAIINGVPDYGDQPGPTENLAVIEGWIYQQWQQQCNSRGGAFQ